MNLETFFNHFELLANAPNGVKKLRELILQLAVQGKLVPQDENDEPASVLLEKIKAEKARLVKEKKIKKSDPLPPITEDEIPYVLPIGWEWVKFVNITSVITCGIASTPNYKENGKIFLSAKNVKPYHFMPEEHKFISEADYLKIIQGGKPELSDILLTRVGAGIGEAAIIDKVLDFAYYVSLTLIKPFHKYIHSKYLLHWLNSPEGITKSLSNTYGKGVSQGNLNVNQVRQFAVPLPPLNEQHRIVEKVDQLIKLCNELETRKIQQKHQLILLGETATNKLINAPNQAEFNHNWQQINQHFDLIYSTPQNIKQLRQAILQLAVMGKLVPQDENDEPASVLLEKINAQKARLVKEKKIKKSDPLTPIKDDEIPYVLPIGWEWVKLGQCIDLISGQHLDKNQQNTEENGLPYITGPSDFSDLNPIITRWTNIFKVIACKNDILVTVKGAGVGKSNILNIEKAAIGRQIMAVRSLLISYHYTYLFILSSYQKLQNLGTGSTVPGLSRENILKLEFSLPPLNEQHRIVEKVDQLMKYCDQLESQLTQATEDSQKLIETAVNQLLAS